MIRFVSAVMLASLSLTARATGVAADPNGPRPLELTPVEVRGSQAAARAVLISRRHARETANSESTLRADIGALRSALEAERGALLEIRAGRVGTGDDASAEIEGRARQRAVLRLDALRAAKGRTRDALARLGRYEVDLRSDDSDARGWRMREHLQRKLAALGSEVEALEERQGPDRLASLSALISRLTLRSRLERPDRSGEPTLTTRVRHRR